MEQQTKIPFDEQIEKAVLGAIMQNNEILLNLTPSLKSNNFYICNLILISKSHLR